MYGLHIRPTLVGLKARYRCAGMNRRQAEDERAHEKGVAIGIPRRRNSDLE